MNPCPPRDRLERLLGRSLLNTELGEIEQHVEVCAVCQQTLDELTGTLEWAVERRAPTTMRLMDPDTSISADSSQSTAGAADGPKTPNGNRESLVPGYEILGELGRGGMGVVYKARHKRLNRACALKMIRDGVHASPEEITRFLTEAEAIARLQHAHIVQIHQIGEANGLPFLELEYLSAGSLDQALDGAPWSAPQAARLAEQVALGIAEAHRQGVLHRDLKPSNVLLAADGTPKVGDFGLAKMADSTAALTQSESVMGSPSYMAPEQARGRAKEAGPAVDIYAVGAILYELLTGRPPFRGTTALETLEQVTTTEPVPPSRLVPGVPRDVETICLKCLQKEPAKRYESAWAVADDLQSFLDGRPIRARRIGSVERAWRWCRRNRFVAATSAVAAAAVLILVVGAIMAALVFRGQRDQIQLADRQTRENLFDSLAAQARATRFSHRMGQRFESLEALKHAALIGRELKLPREKIELLRDQAIACLALPDMRKTGREIHRPPGSLLFAFDPTMKRYALRFRDGTIQVKNVADDHEVARFQARGGRDIYVFGFSPDGRYLATTHLPGFALTVWDVERRTTAVTEPGPVAGTAARFSPDGRRIVVAHPDGEVVIHDLESGRPHRVQSGLGGVVQDLVFRPDGALIAITNRDTKQPACRILELESGRIVQTLTLRSPASVAWSPDCATLATPGADSSVYLWDVLSGTLKSRLEGSSNAGLHATFHPAGKLLASNGWEGRLRIWDAVQGRPVLVATGGDHSGPVFGPDGQISLALEDRLTTYDVDPALEFRTLIHIPSEPLIFPHPSIHRDNRLMAVGMKTGVILWDLARGTECAFLPIGITSQVMFEATGDLLTSGAIGVRRWPVQLDVGRGEFRIGPPSQLPFSSSIGYIAEDRRGRIMARTLRTRVEINISGNVVIVGPLDDCRYIAVSPDGEWLATGSHHFGAQVWRVRDAVKVVDLAVDFGTRVAFSPDGKWLLTASGPSRLWTTATWAFVRELGGEALCFSPDSRLVAILEASKAIRLVEAETGRLIARLESPDLSDVTEATFTPDGSRLALCNHKNPAIHVWDLRSVRRGLVALGLDWDTPTYSEVDAAVPAVPALPLPQVDL